MNRLTEFSLIALLLLLTGLAISPLYIGPAGRRRGRHA